MCGTRMTGVGCEAGDYLAIAADEEGELPIVFHVVRDSDGLGGYVPAEGMSVGDELSLVVEHLNGYFPESSDGSFMTFRFRLEAIHDGATEEYLRSDRFIIAEDDEIDQIRESYGIEGTLNVFLVDEVIEDDETWCGIASFPGSPAQGIVMDWTCLRVDGELGSILAHEVGHYFYLYHPHETYFGPELVRRDQANCEGCGDKLCDTPADPELGKHNVDTLTCEYIGTERDLEGAPYEPDVENVMSYAPKVCRTDFSPEQLMRMTAAFDHALPGTETMPTPPAIPVRAYPNPMVAGGSPATIGFGEPPSAFTKANIAVYDAKGRRVRAIYDGPIDKLDAFDRFRWYADDDGGRPVASGIYFIMVRFEFGEDDFRFGAAKVSVLR